MPGAGVVLDSAVCELVGPVAGDGHRGGDFNTYVFATTDYGATWRSIARLRCHNSQAMELASASGR